MKQETTKEVAIKGAMELAFVKEESTYGTDEVSAVDVRIPRILLAQKMSPITDKKTSGISAGDLWDSVSETKVCDADTVFSFIPINISKSLTTKEKVNGKFEFKSHEKFTPAHANLPYESADGNIKYIKNIDILAIKATDLGNPAALPVYISFRSTSYKCGQDIIADCLQAKARGASSAQLTINIVTETMTNDLGTFYVFKKKASTLTKDYTANSVTFKYWNDLVSSGKATIDEDKEGTSQSSNGWNNQF